MKATYDKGGYRQLTVRVPADLSNEIDALLPRHGQKTNFVVTALRRELSRLRSQAKQREGSGAQVP